MSQAEQARPRIPELLVVVLPDQSGRINVDWLQKLRHELKAARWLAPEAWATDAGLQVLTLPQPSFDWSELRQALLDQHPDHDALVLRSGLALPARAGERLDALRAHRHCPALTIFPGNHDEQLNPATRLGPLPDRAWLDELIHLTSDRHWTPIDPPAVHAGLLCPRLAQAVTGQLDAGLIDDLLVTDPGRELDAGSLDQPAIQVALGPMRLSLQQLLSDLDKPGLIRPGLIGTGDKPVTLHISHDWGGGIARWIADLVAGDPSGHHLILSSAGSSTARDHGQVLKLYAGGPGNLCIARWALTPSIADTVDHHAQYRRLVRQVIDRYRINRVVISSLIGHSLDILESGLPTLQMLHDFYPAWPALDFDPMDFDGPAGPDLDAAIARQAEGFLFRHRQAEHWETLRQHWLKRSRQASVQLVAPTGEVLRRWRELSKDSLDSAQVIAHGFSGWGTTGERIRPQARPDGRLNLVVVGRLSPGKGLGLLQQALPDISRHAQITLLGCGHHGMSLFGQPGVDIILDFAHPDLPRLLRLLAPQGILFLSTVAETWNYVLSETRALGLPPIATRLGSFIERIDDGVDGILFDPTPAALSACLVRLHGAPGELARLAEAAAAQPDIPSRLEAYERLLPLATASEATRLPSPSERAEHQPDDQLAGQRDGLLAAGLVDARIAMASAQHQLDELRTDLEKRTAWAHKSERLFRERSAWARQLQQDIESRDLALEKLDKDLRLVEHHLESEQEHNRDLSQHIEMMSNSLSWRLTRPLRVSRRLLARFINSGAANPLRWPGQIAGLREQVRVHGWRSALQQMHAPPGPASPQAGRLDLPEPHPVDQAPVPVTMARPAQPLASIIIPVYNKVAYTSACLRSLVDSSVDAAFEVIVVDDCSTDETQTYLADCSGIEVLRNDENGGFIHSCNRGASAARGQFLVFLNNDTTVTDGWLDALLSTFEQHDRVGVVGARLVYPDGRLQESGGIIFADGSGWNYGRDQDPGRPEFNVVSEADYVSGACLAIRRSDFEELDGFDPHYAPAYYEDTDLCFRVRQRGQRVFVQPGATVFHHEGITSGTDENSGAKRHQAINREKFMARWGEVLREHHRQGPDFNRADPVRLARFRYSPRRLLLIDAVTPQPDHDSGSVRIVAMMTLLRDMGYQVSFLPENRAWTDGYSRDLQQAGIEVLCAPWVVDIEPWLIEHGRELDLIIVSRHTTLKPILESLRRHCPHARLVFDTVDLHFLREEREAALTGSGEIAAKARHSRTQELELIRASDATLVVSPVEKALLEDLLPDADIRIVSNIHDRHDRGPGWSDRSGLLFVGGFQHVPNVDAATWLIDEIFPLVRNVLPDIELHIIGSRMPAVLAERQVPGVHLHGFVRHLEPWLRRCRLSLAPPRYGAGVKGKVNQAMSYGLPVVATSCAAEGMFLEHGKDVLIGDSAEAFAGRLIDLYNDPELWEAVSVAGQANVERYFSRTAARQSLQALVSDDPGQGVERLP